MRRTKLRPPSPALVVACVALAVALTGAGYAAVAIPRGSVGTVQLKNGAVTSLKVRNGSLKAVDLAAGQGWAATFPGGTLPRGRTLRGVFNAGHATAAVPDVDSESIEFVVPLAAAPEPHFLDVGAPSTDSCPGTAAAPAAAPGHLCLYEASAASRAVVILDPVTSIPDTSSRFGATLLLISSGQAGVEFRSRGTWAVTAP